MFLYGASVTILIVHFSLSVVIQFKKRKILLRAKIFNLVIFFFLFLRTGMDFLTYGGLHSSPLIGDSLKSLSNEIAKIKVKQLHRFLSMGMEEDDLLENHSRLIEFSDNY